VIIAADGIVERLAVDPALDVELASVELVGTARGCAARPPPRMPGARRMVVANTGRVSLLRHRPGTTCCC
jgi:hypothetical protein